MKDTQLYQRATKMVRHLALIEPAAAKVIRALIADINRKDRELQEWREGRYMQALALENNYLRRMLQEKREAVGE